VLKPRPFDEVTIDELTTREPVQAAGAALLQLAIAHRGLLLDGLLWGLPAALAPLGQLRPRAPHPAGEPSIRVRPGQALLKRGLRILIPGARSGATFSVPGGPDPVVPDSAALVG
jgi:hypothetical protein